MPLRKDIMILYNRCDGTACSKTHVPREFWHILNVRRHIKHIKLKRSLKIKCMELKEYVQNGDGILGKIG